MAYVTKHLEDIFGRVMDNYPQPDSDSDSEPGTETVAVPNEVEFTLVGYKNDRGFDHDWTLGIKDFGDLLRGFISKFNDGDKPAPEVMITVFENTRKGPKHVTLPPSAGNARARIFSRDEGLNLKRFCMTNIAPEEDTTYELKNRLGVHDIPEYGLRVRYAHEAPLPIENIEELRSVINNRKVYKKYRFAQRYSVMFGEVGDNGCQLRVDFTSVKEGAGHSFSGAGVVGTGIAKAKDRYEVEVEVAGDNGVTRKDLEAAKEQLFEILGFILTERMGGLTIESYDVIGQNMKAYLSLCYRNWTDKLGKLHEEFQYPSQEMLTRASKYFLAPAIWTLDRRTLDSGDLLPGKNDEARYYFTGKADGLRCLAYINGEGMMYLVLKSGMLLGDRGSSQVNVLNFLPTRLQLVGAPTKDGDPVEVKNSVLDGELVYAHVPSGGTRPYYMPFDIVVHNGTKVTNPSFASRYLLMRKFITADTDTDDDADADAGPRPKLDLLEKKFFEYDHESFKNFVDGGDLRFILDESGTGSTIIGMEAENDGVTYELDGIVFQPANEPYQALVPSWKTVYKYKPSYMLTVDLELNYSKSLQKATGLSLGITNEDDQHYYGVYTASYFVDDRRGKFDLEHSPHRCFADIVTGLPKTQGGEVIGRGDIVECRLAFSQGVLYWQPIRIRYDKYRPNSIAVHNSVLQQIAEPIELSSFTTPKKEFGSEKTFKHNRWISNGFIIRNGLRVRGNINLLDLAFGNVKSGGAWMSIQKSLNKRNRGDRLRIVGVDNCLNASTDITTANVYMSRVINDFSRNLDRPIFTPKDYFFYEESMLVPLHENHEIRRHMTLPESFNVVTNIFAVYYAFINESSFRTYLANISRNLQVGGLFICSYMNADFVEEALGDSNEISGHNNDGKQIWKITRLVDNGTGTGNLFGRKVEITVDGLYDKNHEYLATLTHPKIVSMMKEYGLVRDRTERFSTESKRYNLSPDEKRWTRFHNNICFTKKSIGDDLSVYDTIFDMPTTGRTEEQDGESEPEPEPEPEHEQVKPEPKSEPKRNVVVTTRTGPVRAKAPTGAQTKAKAKPVRAKAQARSKVSVKPKAVIPDPDAE